VKIPSASEKFRNASGWLGDFLHKVTGIPVAPQQECRWTAINPHPSDEETAGI